MKNRRRTRRGNAFTLVELLVVIAIIGILVSIVLPAINNALFRGKLTATTANGRSMIQSIFAKETEQIYSTTTTGWPRYGASTVASNYTFANSTDFFKFLVTGEVMNVNFGFFAAPGVPSASGATDFKADNNAWCIMADVTDSVPETMPVLFTRNLNITTMNTTIANGQGNLPAQLDETQPFGRKGMSFVTKGGAGYAVFKDDLKTRAFTNLFLRTYTDGTVPTNRVLRPGPNF